MNKIDKLIINGQEIEPIDEKGLEMTWFNDDDKLHTVHFDITKEVERIMREINKEIDDEVFKRLSKEKLIKLRQRIDIELQRRYEENENNPTTK